MRETLIYTAALLAMAWATSGKAATTFDEPPAPLHLEQPGKFSATLATDTFLPCLTQAQVEATAYGDTEAWSLYRVLNGERCGFFVDLAQNYVPGDDRFYFAVPDPIPVVPSPVPLQGSLGFLSIAIFAMCGLKMRMK